MFFECTHDKNKIDTTIQIFKKLERDSIYKGCALTYIGALTALTGKYSALPINKYTKTKRGLAIMDKGIQISPNNLEALFIHGMTCYYLPFFFFRKKNSIKNFKHIIRLMPAGYPDYDPDIVLNVIQFIFENIVLHKQEKETLLKIYHEVKKL
jgi:hypothetical protein